MSGNGLPFPLGALSRILGRALETARVGWAVRPDAAFAAFYLQFGYPGGILLTRGHMESALAPTNRQPSQ